MRGGYVDVAGDREDAAELGDLAELQRHPADEGVVQRIAGVDPKLADGVHLHQAQT